MGSNIIITGASGMVGEGVLLQAIQNEKIGKILVVGRRHCGIKHHKIEEVLVNSFADLSEIEDKFKNIDSCFFCSGVSSVGMQEEEYRKITYDLTLNFAKTLLKQSPKSSFIYVSGQGTSGNETKGQMWNKIKSKTENDLMSLGFKSTFMFRPGFMKPTSGQKNVLKYYKYFTPFYPILRLLFPTYILTLAEVGNAMINTLSAENKNYVCEPPFIKKLAYN